MPPGGLSQSHERNLQQELLKGPLNLSLLRDPLERFHLVFDGNIGIFKQWLKLLEVSPLQGGGCDDPI